MHSQSKKLLEELRKLNLPGGQYAVFSSGPMAVRGIKLANDIDIFAIQRL